VRDFLQALSFFRILPFGQWLRQVEKGLVRSIRFLNPIAGEGSGKIFTLLRAPNTPLLIFRQAIDKLILEK